MNVVAMTTPAGLTSISRGDLDHGGHAGKSAWATRALHVLAVLSRAGLDPGHLAGERGAVPERERPAHWSIQEDLERGDDDAVRSPLSARDRKEVVEARELLTGRRHSDRGAKVILVSGDELAPVDAREHLRRRRAESVALHFDEFASVRLEKRTGADLQDAVGADFSPVGSVRHDPPARLGALERTAEDRHHPDVPSRRDARRDDGPQVGVEHQEGRQRNRRTIGG
jgi:hypothetical protein